MIRELIVHYVIDLLAVDFSFLKSAPVQIINRDGLPSSNTQKIPEISLFHSLHNVFVQWWLSGSTPYNGGRGEPVFNK